MTNTDAESLGKHIVELFAKHSECGLYVGKCPTVANVGGDEIETNHLVWFVGEDGKRLTSTRISIGHAIAAVVGDEPLRRCYKCRREKPVECFTGDLYICKSCHSVESSRLHHKRKKSQPPKKRIKARRP